MKPLVECWVVTVEYDPNLGLEQQPKVEIRHPFAGEWLRDIPPLFYTYLWDTEADARAFAAEQYPS